jgi:hypothetical protein
MIFNLLRVEIGAFQITFALLWAQLILKDGGAES